MRSADAAFVAKERLGEGWDEGADGFLNLASDFVIEIRSQNDSLKKLQEKMEEYITNGVRLGWLIDRKNKLAYVESTSVLQNFFLQLTTNNWQLTKSV